MKKRILFGTIIALGSLLSAALAPAQSGGPSAKALEKRAKVGEGGMAGLDYAALSGELSGGRLDDAKSRLLSAAGSRAKVKARESEEIVILLMDLLSRADLDVYSKEADALAASLLSELESAIPDKPASDGQRRALSLAAGLHERFFHDSAKAEELYRRLLSGKKPKKNATPEEASEQAYSELASKRLAAIGRLKSRSAEIVDDAKLRKQLRSAPENQL